MRTNAELAELLRECVTGYVNRDFVSDEQFDESIEFWTQVMSEAATVLERE